MSILNDLLEILERRKAAWEAVHAASDHYRKVRDDDERASVIAIASQRSGAADDYADQIERELDDVIRSRLDELYEALRATVGKDGGR